MAVEFCNNPVGGRHELRDQGRRVSVQLAVDWGADDLRDAHEKPVRFCSFACLAAWATEKAAQHDGNVVRDGTP